jgi:hypothetical protein
VRGPPTASEEVLQRDTPYDPCTYDLRVFTVDELEQFEQELADDSVLRCVSSVGVSPVGLHWYADHSARCEEGIDHPSAECHTLALVDGERGSVAVGCGPYTRIIGLWDRLCHARLRSASLTTPITALFVAPPPAGSKPSASSSLSSSAAAVASAQSGVWRTLGVLTTAGWYAARLKLVQKLTATNASDEGLCSSSSLTVDICVHPFGRLGVRFLQILIRTISRPLGTCWCLKSWLFHPRLFHCTRRRVPSAVRPPYPCVQTGITPHQAISSI